MKLKVFGPNLRDQSKGLFVVHKSDCADCGKLRGEECNEMEAESKSYIVESFYGIPDAEDVEWGNTTEARMADFHFAPCVKLSN